MTTGNASAPAPRTPWVRIPDGTRVRHRTEAYEGIVDGLTEIVSGPGRNPDGKTQYRVKVDDGSRMLVSEADLTILLDKNNLILVARQSELYRRNITDRLRAVFGDDRFVTIAPTRLAASSKKTALNS